MGAREKKSKKPSATKAELLLEQTTLFVDRSLGRHVGLTLRAAGLTVELHDDHFQEDTTDVVWLAEVASKNWVVLTKDKAIRRNWWERQVVMEASVRMFTLPNGNMTGQEMAEMYLANRPKMARFLKKNCPPFVAVVGKSGVTLVAPKPEEAEKQDADG